MRLAGAALVALVAIAALFLGVLRHPQYTPDGIVYARFAARDAGYSERDATLTARAYYEHTAMMSNPRYRDLIELDPSVSFARSKVFENRVLYPWTVGLLLRTTGFRALFIVSAVSYLAFGLALYWMLLAFGRPALAAVIAIAALALPLTRQMAASDLTDMFSMVWWTLALGALLHWMRGARASWLILLAVSAALLALTRPTPYLIIAPAAAAAILRRSWWPLLASCTAGIAFAIAAAATHAFGIGEQLQWVYSHRPAREAAPSFSAWYRSALASTIRFTIVAAVKGVVPVLAIAAAIYNIARSRLREESIVLLAAAAACCVAIPFNPVPSSIARVIGLPLVPVFCAIFQSFAVTFVIERMERAAPDRRPSRHSATAR